jgi:hypothetical protein
MDYEYRKRNKKIRGGGEGEGRVKEDMGGGGDIILYCK